MVLCEFTITYWHIHDHCINFNCLLLPNCLLNELYENVFQQLSLIAWYSCHVVLYQYYEFAYLDPLSPSIQFYNNQVVTNHLSTTRIFLLTTKTNSSVISNIKKTFTFLEVQWSFSNDSVWLEDEQYLRNKRCNLIYGCKEQWLFCIDYLFL